MKFYKYYSPKIGEKVIRELKIKGTDPNYTNDPYEFAPEVSHCNEGGEFATLSSEKIEPLKSIFSKKYRLICGSTNIDNILLWSHYADAHTGIAIEFNVLEKPFGNISNEYKGNVNYQSSRSIFFAIKEMSINSFKDQFIKMALHKALIWEYEKEYRFIEQTSNFDCIGLIDIDPKSINTIIFGFHCEQSVIKSVMKLLKRKELQHVEVACIDLSYNEHKLKIHPSNKEKINKKFDDCVRIKPNKTRHIISKLSSFLFCIKNFIPKYIQRNLR